MKIEVVATAQQLSERFTKDKTVVVIDVLRATSVITTALFHGAAAVWPVLSVEEANALFQRFPAGTALRGGERGGMKIDGFEQGNSPLSYTAGTVSNKHLILTTTNGTVALRNSLNAKAVYAVSLLNLPYAAAHLSAADELAIVCSGTNGNFSADDALCAGMLIAEIEKYEDVSANDLAWVVKQFANQPGRIAEKLSACFHLNYLQSIGYQADIDFCLQQGIMPLLPVLQSDGSIRAMMRL